MFPLDDDQMHLKENRRASAVRYLYSGILAKHHLKGRTGSTPLRIQWALYIAWGRSEQEHLNTPLRIVVVFFFSSSTDDRPTWKIWMKWKQNIYVQSYLRHGEGKTWNCCAQCVAVGSVLFLVKCRWKRDQIIPLFIQVPQTVVISGTLNRGVSLWGRVTSVLME